MLKASNTQAPTRDETVASTTDTETPKTGTDTGTDTGTGTGQNVGLGLEATTREKISGTVPHPADSGNQKMRVYSNGVVKIGKTTYSLTKRMRGQIVFALWDSQGVMFANTDGEIIAEYLWPPEGTGYVGAGQSLTRFRQTPLHMELSPMS
ncbi:hypothetical protein ACX80R_18545 [Paeniglutamicibacter antarcticus]|uniref:Uncharacterized protein n=1 Tax=Paeniglutamicibacter antarcticus TaxID=494023 RepID=A0ABP9TG05_9MICC